LKERNLRDFNAPLAPTGQIESWVPIIEIDSTKSSDLDNLRNESAAVYIYGEITYQDIFKRKHRTKFRIVHRKRKSVDEFGTPIPYKTGNEAT